jgi:hypothetical protein
VLIMTPWKLDNLNLRVVDYIMQRQLLLQLENSVKETMVKKLNIDLTHARAL